MRPRLSPCNRQTSTGTVKDARIDLAKLRNRVRIQPHETVYAMLDNAFDLLTAANLTKLIRQHLPLEDLHRDEPEPKRDSLRRLRVAVEAFAAASHRGDYFDPFDVNSRNYTEQSNGTTAWIGECNRLLSRCVERTSHQRTTDGVMSTFELLFDLIEQAVSCEFDILFFADEGGVWSLGFDWPSVARAWFDCTKRAKGSSSRARRIADSLASETRPTSAVDEELARVAQSFGGHQP